MLAHPFANLTFVLQTTSSCYSNAHDWFDLELAVLAPMALIEVVQYHKQVWLYLELDVLAPMALLEAVQYHE